MIPEGILDVYTLEELIEYNDLTTLEVLEYLVDKNYLTLPEITPLDFYD